jgi:predicted RND superfamily exporter protein
VSSDVSSRILGFVRDHLQNRPKTVFAAAALILAGSIYGLSMMEVNMNSMDFFQEGSELKIADSHMNEKLAGTQSLNINIESTDGSPVITPTVLEKVERFQEDVHKRFRIVGKTVSVGDYLKKMNQEMNGGSSAFYRLPETQEKAAEYLLLYSGNIDHMISRSRDKLRIHMSLNRSKMNELRKVRDYAVSFFDGNFLRENNLRVTPSGFMDMMLEANTLVAKGQLTSLLSSILLVTVLIYLIFRNIG